MRSPDPVPKRPRVPPTVKSWLIDLNLVMDRLLSVVKRHTIWEPCSLVDADDLTPFEEYVRLLEDRYYFRHAGFDLRRVPRLTKQAILLRRLGGVSTIE